MAADLQPVDIFAHVVGVVDHPGGKPQHLAVEFLQELQGFVVHGGSTCLRGLMGCGGFRVFAGNASHQNPINDMASLAAPGRDRLFPLLARRSERD